MQDSEVVFLAWWLTAGAIIFVAIWLDGRVSNLEKEKRSEKEEPTIRPLRVPTGGSHLGVRYPYSRYCSAGLANGCVACAVAYGRDLERRNDERKQRDPDSEDSGVPGDVPGAPR